MNKKFLLIPSIFILIILSFFYLLMIDRDPSKIPSQLLNKNVPNFESDLLLKNDKFISLEEIGEEKILVNFFATWCKPCHDEHVFIRRFSNEIGIRIIGINYKDNSEKAKIWLKNLGNPYSDIPIDKTGSIAIDWGVYGIPETFLVNSKGIIKYRHVGQITEDVYKKINRLISNIQ